MKKLLMLLTIRTILKAINVKKYEEAYTVSELKHVPIITAKNTIRKESVCLILLKELKNEN